MEMKQMRDCIRKRTMQIWAEIQSKTGWFGWQTKHKFQIDGFDAASSWNRSADLPMMNGSPGDTVEGLGMGYCG